ncbi:signal peptidase I [Candidatus Pacearchaeota archaeon]|nr:signal peptidase I [Candidatus Pacearchaeota archaeon]
MDSIINGNLENYFKNNLDKRGWFMGNFIEKNSIFHNKKFEMRWAMHKKGEKKDPPAMNKKSKTISILIKGKMLLKFPLEKKQIILSKQGDYVSWENGIYHGSEMLEDSIVLTIR